MKANTKLGKYSQSSVIWSVIVVLFGIITSLPIEVIISSLVTVWYSLSILYIEDRILYTRISERNMLYCIVSLVVVAILMIIGTGLVAYHLHVKSSGLLSVGLLVVAIVAVFIDAVCSPDEDPTGDYDYYEEYASETYR